MRHLMRNLKLRRMLRLNQLPGLLMSQYPGPTRGPDAYPVPNAIPCAVP